MQKFKQYCCLLVLSSFVGCAVHSGYVDETEQRYTYNGALVGGVTGLMFGSGAGHLLGASVGAIAGGYAGKYIGKASDNEQLTL